MDAWRNRIVGRGEKPASQFLANPSNWRRHSPEQQAALEALLARVGWVQGVVENRVTGHLVDGELRVRAALKRGDETPIPYVEVDLTPDEEALVLAVYDPLSAMATSDREALGALVASIHAEDLAIANLLKNLALEAQPPNGETVSFQVEDRPTCPTCGQKLKKGKTLPQETT